MVNIKDMAIRKRLIMLIPALVLMAYALRGNTQPEFYSRYMKYSSEELLRMGNTYAEKSKLADSALVCFSDWVYWALVCLFLRVLQLRKVIRQPAASQAHC